MANNFAADFKSVWSKEQQRIFYKTNVARMIADLSYQSDLSAGDTLKRPARSLGVIQKYSRGTAIKIKDKADTNEQLVVNAQFATGMYIDDFDKIQSNYDLAANYGKDNGVFLSNQVDADVLGEVANAASVVDDGTLGGTAGNGIALTTSNVLSVLSAAKKKLMKKNVPVDQMFGVISPEFEEIMTQFGIGRDTIGSDTVLNNGYFTSIYGFKLYRSNQLSNVATLFLNTVPGAGETVVIGPQTFTFVAGPVAAAGDVLIVGGNAAATRLNLVTLINAPGTTTANGFALTGDNLDIFQNVVSAVNDIPNTQLTVTFKGVGAISVSETLAAVADIWTPAKIIQQNFFGAIGCPVLVMQKEPAIQVKEVPDKLGKNILDGMLYGFKTFADNSQGMVNVKIKAATF